MASTYTRRSLAAAGNQLGGRNLAGKEASSAVAELEQKSRWGALQIKLFNDIERTHINS
jgi:hypothetical protein